MQEDRVPGQIVRLEPETPEIEQKIVEILTEDASNDDSSSDADGDE